MRTYTIVGDKAGEALNALRNLAASDFDASFLVLSEQMDLVKVEYIMDPRSMFYEAIKEMVETELPKKFNVIVKVE